MLAPRMHEVLAELCMIPTDHLSEEEWALVQVHLAYCNLCLDKFREQQQQAHDVSLSIDETRQSQGIDRQ